MLRANVLKLDDQELQIIGTPASYHLTGKLSHL
jgi:hypothetical protein